MKEASKIVIASFVVLVLLTGCGAGPTTSGPAAGPTAPAITCPPGTTRTHYSGGDVITDARGYQYIPISNPPEYSSGMRPLPTCTAS